MNKTTEALKRVEVWVESLTGLHTDVRQEQGEILAAIREALAEPVCEHHIADARNEFVRDGYICIKCGALFRAADHAEPVKQEPASNKYNHKRIGWELERTAMGDSYYGNALYSAMDLHFLNKREKDCLHRYMHGSETPNDRFVLQDIANKVYFEPEAEQEKQEPVAVVDEIGKRLDGTYIFNAVGKVEVGQPLYAAPLQPVNQEPVGYAAQSVIDWLSSEERTASAYSGINLYKNPTDNSTTPLYAAPVSAKREWVDLEPWHLCEIEERVGLPIDSHDFETIGNAYIAAFKEKNR